MSARVATSLNPSQRAAVEHEHGPLLVLAGAGSGKTSVVTQRIARLIERGHPARSILAMTFTNKAAGEMFERVARLVGAQQGRDLTVSTFHRFGLTVLGKETRALGMRGTSFAIFDQADTSGVVREILRTVKTGKNYDIGAILARISAAKNAFLDADEWAKRERESRGLDDYDEIASIVYPKYQSALKSFQAFDFDDLICEVVRLWRKRKDVLDKWRQRYRFVIVDEYQDTNHAQLELTRLLVEEHKNVCVGGDDDQAIYAWRGADVRNILDFQEHFPGAKVIKLEHNYRSVGAVLDLANAVLQKQPGRRHKKTLMATRDKGPRVEVIVAADPDVEAAFAANEIQKALEEKGLRPRDCAILYRSNLQAQPLEAALKERQIPYRMIGGQQFFERKEVKDLLAYLRVVLDPEDEMALRRIVNYPARGIGEAALAKLTSYATAKDTTLWHVVSKPYLVNEFPAVAMDGCRQLLRITDGARQRLAKGEPSAQVLRYLAEEIKLKEDIIAGSTTTPAAQRRWNNIEGLFVLFSRRDEQGKGGGEDLIDYLRFLTLQRDDGDEEAEDKVTLTTMHGTKGLEYKLVFVVGLEEGLLPHARTLGDRATDIPLEGAHSLDEERRLFYVAVTRAKDKLYLCRSRVRLARGKMMPRTISRFLQDIPPDLYDEREVNAPEAPPLEKTVAGASALLAALSSAPTTGEAPLMMRRRR
ncbi:MAG: UvrD-helicase domain-containing protein [Polyangiaceae bacterium]|nr:UvrD-helicase domain-containing protein [Polyangiaceae bacterium]